MIFFKNFLEPLAYLLYTFLLLISIDRNSSISRRILFVYYLAALFLTYYANYLSFTKTLGDNNYLYNLFFFITACTFSYYFYQLLTGRMRKMIVIFLLAVNLFLFIFYEIINRKFDGSYNNYVNAACFLSIVVYSFMYFHQLLRNVNELNILHEFNFWLISGYLLYFLGSFFIVLFYSEFTTELRGMVWAFQNIILLTSALIALTGNLWIKYRTWQP
ncbi:MAG: hypothetical protein M3015_07050 [Bacteroidota bacterium]|nr:hypothetical protein [Bacteroidota bacterium]